MKLRQIIFSYCYILASSTMQNQRNESVSSLNIEILEKVKRESRYKSGLEMTLMGFVISMCAIMFGYGLTEISTIPIQTLVDKYHIPMAPSLAQGLLIGIMPFGGIFGAILFKYLLASLRRRTSIFFISIWMMVSIVLVEITTVETLFLGRFLQGICIGLYVSIGPIYLRQIVARQLRPQIMSIFSLCKVLGIVFAYSLQNILDAVGFEGSWRILLGFNGVFCLIQALLVFFFIPDSPVEMVEKVDYVEARKTISALYNNEFVEEILEEMKKDYEAEKAKTKPPNMIGNLVAAAVSYTKNRKRALLMAVHITTFRQFIGGNVLVTFSGQIIGAFPNMHSEAKYTALVINCMQLLTNAISLFTTSKTVGRRPLFLIGSVGLTIINFGIALALFFELQILILIMMSSYMLLYGATFLPVSWSYPSEIIPAEQAVFANTLGWIATSIVVSVPPIVVGAMYDHNAFPLFFFFGTYGVFGTIYIYLKLVESKGRTYEEIIKEY